MTNNEWALRLWPMLVLAARTQQVLSYMMVERMTGMDRRGAGGALGSIYYYCKRHKLPLLNLLVVNQETGKPGMEFVKDVELSAGQARVFVFDWLAHGIPSKEDLKRRGPA